MGLLFTITWPSTSSSLLSTSYERYNTKQADWELFSLSLENNFKDFNYLIENQYSNPELDTIVEIFTKRIIVVADYY